jgi:hypothetical protein
LRAANDGLAFNGVGSAVALNAPNLNPANITVEAWFMAPSYYGVGNDPLVDKAYTSHSEPYYQYHLSIVGDQYFPYPGTIGFSVSVGGSQYAVNAVGYTVGQWCYAAGTYDGETVSLYINGDLAASSTIPSGPMDAFDTELYLAAFRNYPFATPVTLDEVRIWGYARSQAELQAAMNHELTGTESGLIAYYNFNQPDNSTLYDMTGNHNAGLYGVGAGQFITPGAPVQPVPEPGSLALAVLSLAATLGVRRRK